MKVLEEQGGQQGGEEGPALLEAGLLPFHAAKSGPVEQKTIMRTEPRAEYCPVFPAPAVKFGKRLLSLFPWTRAKKRHYPGT